MINVLIVDDHASTRKSLRVLLESTDDIKVIATASDGIEAIDKARARCPDVAVIDISMPRMDGIEAARQIHQHCRSTRLVMLSIFDTTEYVQRAVEVGASGFVLKDAIGEDLLAAIRALYSGNRYFSQKIAHTAQKYLNRKGNDSWVG